MKLGETLQNNEQPASTDTISSGFAHRLRELIGAKSTSAFARQVGMSEGMIRKYLNGSEPSLAKANQIAMRANCSLEWLATGCGYLYRKAEVVDAEALRVAIELILDEQQQQAFSDQEKQWHQVISTYQFLRTIKRPDGYFDKALAKQFLVSKADEI